MFPLFNMNSSIKTIYLPFYATIIVYLFSHKTIFIWNPVHYPLHALVFSLTTLLLIFPQLLTLQRRAALAIEVWALVSSLKALKISNAVHLGGITVDMAATGFLSHHLISIIQLSFASNAIYIPINLSTF
jgi:hypothetical protein